MIMIVWITLMAANLMIQIAYFFHDSSSIFYTAKRVSTPLLLFWGLIFSMAEQGGLTLVPGAIFLAMGMGEIGIEGSTVVEERKAQPGKLSILAVNIAGGIFLLVNIFLGGLLVFRSHAFFEGEMWKLPASAAAALVIIYTVVSLLLHNGRPDAGKAAQIRLYAVSVWVLLSGALVNILSGGSPAGYAAATLSISDTLVLIRMGSRWKKSDPSQRRILFVFLLGILLLYYGFMIILADVR